MSATVAENAVGETGLGRALRGAAIFEMPTIEENTAAEGYEKFVSGKSEKPSESTWIRRRKGRRK